MKAVIAALRIALSATRLSTGASLLAITGVLAAVPAVAQQSAAPDATLKAVQQPNSAQMIG